MKILAFLLLIAALLFGAYYYFQPKQARDLLRDADLITTPEVTRVYKWQDKEGNWHVSDQPPPEGTSFETRDYRSDENVLPLPPQLQSE